MWTRCTHREAVYPGAANGRTGDTHALTFEFRNVGVGPDPLSLERTAELVDFATLLLVRDYHCPKCRAQVRRVAGEAETIERRDTAVIPVLPDSYGKAADWQAEYDLPFPLLADPDGAVVDGDDRTRRFGTLGKRYGVIGRMPKAVAPDSRGEPTLVESHDGSTPGGRPPVGDLLGIVDDLRGEFVSDCELVEC